MLSLNVRYRTGFDPKPMEFKQDALIRDVITMIVSKHDLPLHYPYVLFNPQADPVGNAGWLRADQESTLFSTSLRNNDIVELMCEPAQLHFSRYSKKDYPDLNRISLSVLNSTKKTGQLDFTEPLYKLLPMWVKAFPFKKKKKLYNYCILRLQVNENHAQVIGMLNINISPMEANLAPNGHLLLAPLDFFDRPASSVKGPTYVGYASLKIKKGENKYTKAKKYLFVQKYNILYYFSSRSSLSSEGMIDLQYMTVSVKNLEVRLTLTTRWDRSLLAATPEFVLESDVHNVKELTRRVWRHSASGAGKHVFGVSLTHLWDRKYSVDLPVVVTSCCEYISKYGINTEGVFQDPGSKETMEMLKDEFDKGVDVDLNEINPDPHSVGQILKHYLMELSEPILTFALYSEFWKVRNNTNSVMLLLATLPCQNQLLVKYLSSFFLEFVRHAAANRITLHGLAQFFTPCFLRPKDDQVMHEISMMSSVLATLIANCESFTPLQRIRSLSRANRLSVELSRMSIDVSNSNFSPPFPLHSKDSPSSSSAPTTPPKRYSARLEKLLELHEELARESPNSSQPTTPTSALVPPPSLVTPPASPMHHQIRPAPPSAPPSPIVRLPSSLSMSNLSPESAPPPPSKPASSTSSSSLSLSSLIIPPSPTVTPAPLNLTPPPSLPTPPTPTLTSTSAPPLPAAPSPVITRTASPIPQRLSGSFRPFVLPPSPNTLRRTQGQTAPDASATPVAAAAYAAAAAMDAAADARAAALAALAALDYLDAGMSAPSTPDYKHGSIALGAPPPLPPLDAPPMSYEDFGKTRGSFLVLGAPPPPPPS